MTGAVAAAMILAAGRGARMRPLSDQVAKPALPLPDGPLISWAVKQAADCCPRQVVVNTFHLAATVERALKRVALPGVKPAISREPRLMDTAGGLAMARDRGLLGAEGPVLVLNGDCVMRLDLQPLLDRHQREGDAVTLALLPHLDPESWSRVILDENSRVTEFLPPGKPLTSEVPFLYSGAMVISRDALDALPSRVGGIWTELWSPALGQRRLGAAVVTGHWREVGTPQGYLDAVIDRLGESRCVHARARIHRDATVGVALVGSGSRVGAGAVVAESVICEGARVGRNARVIRSVLLGKVSVAEEESVVDRFVVP